MDPHMQISCLVGERSTEKHSPGPGRNFKPITFSEQPIGSIIPQQQVTKGFLMSCRQHSLPEAPNGQKYIPWCLQAFVLEKPLQAQWVPFWRQLPWQVRGGRELRRRTSLCSSPRKVLCREVRGRRREEGGGLGKQYI